MTRPTAETARRAAYQRGSRAEGACALWLRLQGYRILARRFRSPVGEVDLIARRGNLVAFVEVKSRPTLEQALQAVTPGQRRRVVRAAEAFLAANPWLAALDIRFDLMAVAPWRRPRHLAGAWTADRSPER